MNDIKQLLDYIKPVIVDCTDMAYVSIARVKTYLKRKTNIEDLIADFNYQRKQKTNFNEVIRIALNELVLEKKILKTGGEIRRYPVIEESTVVRDYLNSLK